MSAENVELVRRWFRGFERAELGLDLCHPAIEIRNWPLIGHEGVKRWWDDIGDAVDDLDWARRSAATPGDELMTGRRYAAQP